MSQANDASILLIPTAYKTSKVYSVFPNDGNGDFIFSRSGKATRINANGFVEEMPNNIPRMDYSDGNCSALLLEQSSTNLFTDYLGVSGYSGGGSGSFGVTANFAISPDGTQNATKLTATTGSRQHKQDIAVIGDNTISCYLKTNTGTKQIRLMINDTHRLTVNVTNQWQRFETTTNVTSIIGSGRCGLVSLDILDDNQYILVYGLQLENQSQSTSLIPTTTVAVTRFGETCLSSAATDPSIIQNDEFTLFCHVKDITSTLSRISLNDGTGSNKYQFNFSSAGEVYFSTVIGGASVTNHFQSGLGSEIKVAVRVENNNRKMYVNGQVASIINSTLLNSSLLTDLDLSQTSTSLPFYGKLKRLDYYNTPLTDAQLLALTQ